MSDATGLHNFRVMAGYRAVSKKELREILWKRDNGMALNLRELAAALGYSYATIITWRREGLPLVDGRLPAKEAWDWRRAYLADPKNRIQEDNDVEKLVPAVLRAPRR